MKKKPLLVSAAPHPQTHRDAIFDLTAKVFHYHGYWNWLACCRDGYFDRSHYDWTASRIGFVDDQLVTHYGIWGYDMRIGSAKVRVGGVGAVATHGEFRKHGLMAQTAAACMRDLSKYGYDFSLLFGIANFYHRFGFTHAFPSQTYVLPVGELKTVGQPPAMRKFRYLQSADLDDLYNRTHDNLTGTAVRPTYFRRNGFVKGQGYRWLDGRGRLRGAILALAESDKLIVEDCLGDPAEIVTACARLVRNTRIDEVRFPRLHPRGALAKFLRAGTCRVDLYYDRSGGAMVCLVSLRAALEKMAGELTNRLQNSPSRDWQGRLALENAQETVVLKIAKGQVSVESPGQGTIANSLKGGPELAQLLIGSREPEELVSTGLIQCCGAAAHLLPSLFPAQEPMLGNWDGF